MKKVLILITMLFMFFAIGCSEKKEVSNASESQAPKQEQKENTSQTSKNESKSEKITFSNVTVKGHDGVTEVLGEAKNNDSKKHTFTIKVTFYDNDKKILGIAQGSITNLDPGKTETFQAAATEDFSKASSNKVEIGVID